jgi:hypothetical protein
LLTRRIDRTTYVDAKVQDAYVKGYEQLAIRRPILGVLQCLLAWSMLRWEKIDIKPLDHLVYTSPPKRNSESSHGLDLLDVENVYL